MAWNPELDQFLEQARNRLAGITDRKLREDALSRMKSRHGAWKTYEYNFIKGLPRGISAQSKPAVEQIATIRADFYKDIEAIARDAETRQHERADKNRRLDDALMKRLAEKSAEKDRNRDKGGRGR